MKEYSNTIEIASVQRIPISDLQFVSIDCINNIIPSVTSKEDDGGTLYEFSLTADLIDDGSLFVKKLSRIKHLAISLKEVGADSDIKIGNRTLPLNLEYSQKGDAISLSITGKYTSSPL